MYVTLIALLSFLVVITGCLSLKMYFEKIKGDKEWSAWANIITATGTVVVGVATIIVMFQENNTQLRLAKMEEAEHQPIFVVDEVPGTSTNEEAYDYEDFSVFNLGGLVKSIAKVEVLVFAQVDYAYKVTYETKKVYVPIKDYYFRYYNTGALQGEIARSYGSFQNHNNQLFVQRLYWGKTTLENIQWVKCELIKFYIVEYTDVYDKTKTVVFKGTSPGLRTEQSTMSYVSDLVTLADSVFGSEKYDLKDLTLDKIITIADQR